VQNENAHLPHERSAPRRPAGVIVYPSSHTCSKRLIGIAGSDGGLKRPCVTPVTVGSADPNSSNTRQQTKPKLSTSSRRAQTLSRHCHEQVRIRRVAGGRLETILAGRNDPRATVQQRNSLHIRLGVKWLSRSPRSPTLRCAASFGSVRLCGQLSKRAGEVTTSWLRHP
jgi:hypothetical protein